ncbi:MAG: PfkB family carbohydrate kinase [Catenulispora sp.]
MRATGPLVVIGDALLDRDLDGTASRLVPDSAAPVLPDPTERVRPGGAALTALLAARSGVDTILVAPLGQGPAAEKLRALLTPLVRVVELPWTGQIPEKIRIRADGRVLVRLDHDGGRFSGPLGPEAVAALASAGAILVSDYGRGVTAGAELRRLLAARAKRVPLVWDPHPAGMPPVAGTRLVTPNLAEAIAVAADEEAEGPNRAQRSSKDGSAVSNGSKGSKDSPRLNPRPPRRQTYQVAVDAARRLVRRWSVSHVCVTLGGSGALLVGDRERILVPAPPVTVMDPCGAGDRFAAAAAAALRRGALVSEAVDDAVRAAARFLAEGGVGGLSEGTGPGRPTLPAGSADAWEVAQAVHAAGGTVVATGGCFDLLHAGHVRCLSAARAAGDCLIVCLNSDDSVRALKGPGRPVVPAADRRAMLEALECVDAVIVFDEPTPAAVLSRLRPDVWVKGGDYDAADLPEAELLRSWGGQALTVPYLDGRSTTTLLRAATGSRG